MAVWWILAGSALLALSGVPGLFAGPRAAWGQGAASALSVLGAALGLTGAGLALARGGEEAVRLAWAVPVGALALGLDALSAFFLVPVFLLGALAALYGQGYWPQARHPDSGRRLRLFSGLLVAGMALVLLARDGVLFLMAWEAMALSAYFLIATEHGDPEVRRAGWNYLVATHLGSLCLLALFALLRTATGSFALVPLTPAQAGPWLAPAAFLLALVGFGLKAGLMPLHVWLPGAHANAPSQVSALMSGIVIKLGIYGLLRTAALLPDLAAGWGGLVLVLGVVSGVLGVAFALGQHDLKRLLAYHSIENIGIILIGLGLALLGRALGRADWVLLGLAGALLHVWNHGLFKSLLFFSAGSVLHGTGTRQIDRLGGLAKTMPRTALMFLVGAVAICGLPPLNGFVSEFLIYLGLFRTLAAEGGAGWSWVAVAVPALAMIGALAVACFVKVYGAVFLGLPRSQEALARHEAPRAMTGPMFVLAGACALIGLAPWLLAPVLESAVRAWAPGAAETSGGLVSLAPLGAVGAAALALTGAGLAGGLALRALLRRRAVRGVGTWDCGYAAGTARMQYTASSFAQMLVQLFGFALRPREHLPAVAGLFPAPARFESHVDDAVLDGLVLPVLERTRRGLLAFRFLQQGRVQQYLLYILLTVVALLVWTLPLTDFVTRLFAG